MHGRHLFLCVKGVWVWVGLHILNNDSRVNSDEVTVDIVGEGVVVHPGCGVPDASFASHHSVAVPTLVGSRSPLMNSETAISRLRLRPSAVFT